jgi:4-amino-4-deoxy-L-arabinose transferase-like glycosyltransferase
MSDVGVATREPDAWLRRLDPLRRRGLRGRLLASLALLAVSALPLLLLAPLFGTPFEPDEGAYGTIARGWLNGAIPYRDLWDNKGPLLYLWYAASFVTLGESTVAPRIFAAIAAGLSVLFTWATARTLFDRRLAAIAAALFALSFLNIYIQVAANSEVFMLLPATAGLWAFAVGARSHNLLAFFAAGALTSLALFTRQSAVFILIGYCAWVGVLSIRYPEERPRLLRGLGALAAGAALGATPFVVYFAVHSALYDLWFAMFEFNWTRSGELPIYMKLVPPIVNPVPLTGGLAFWTLAGLGVWRLTRRGGRFSWLIITFLASSEAAAQTMGRLFPHYSVHLMPGAALAGAFGVLFVRDRWREGRRTPAYALAATALITLGAAAFVYTQPTAAQRFEVQYWWRAQGSLVAPEIAEAIATMTEPRDYVYEWGTKSQIYFLADRQPASRWLHNRAYEVDKSIIDEVITDLHEKQPKVILLRVNHYLPGELSDYLEEHYRFAERVEYALIYQLKESSR